MDTMGNRQQHLFIVRVWQEPSQLQPPGQWRGSVEHVPSGQRLYFASMNDLTNFMTFQLNSDGESAGESASPAGLH